MLNLPSINAHDAEPITAQNAAYQNKIAYRSDDYSSLRYKLLQHLEDAFPNWNRMLANKQGSQDFGVALIEMFSYVADILGFYQDCRANEAYLRTATLKASLIELCELIDYKIPPGVSASSLQAFFCKDGGAGTIPAGFRVKNQPQGGETAVTFETFADLDVSSALNQLYFYGYDRSELLLSVSGAQPETSVLLDQGYAGLKAGAFVVITCPSKPSIPLQLLAVADEGTLRRISWKPGALPADQNLPIADVVILGKPTQQMQLADSVRADEIAAGQISVAVEDPAAFPQTWIHWHHRHHPIVFVAPGFQQAAQLLSVVGPVISWAPALGIPLRRSETSVYYARQLADHVYAPVAPGDRTLNFSGGQLNVGDMAVLTDETNLALVRITRVSASKYTLADPIIQAFPSGGLLFSVSLPDPDSGTSGSDFSAVSPVRLPVGTSQLVLDQTYSNLLPGQAVVVSDGEVDTVCELTAVDIDNNQSTVLTVSPALTHAFKVATTVVSGPFELQMRIDGYNRSVSSVAAGKTAVSLDGQVQGLTPGRYLIVEDSSGAEAVRIMTISYQGGHTDIDLDAALSREYALADTVVLGNVVEITHGESVLENPLGSGDQSQANQTFQLNQSPTTFVHDPEGARGISDTLQVFVGDELWAEVDSLANSGADDHHVMVTIDEDQNMSFEGGDGRFGAKFPTGLNNISAQYRHGSGIAGNLERNTITAMAAPLAFLQSSRNPVASSGGADPQDLETTRQMAPIAVRTVDRAVTLQDYQDLALSYAGIAKANVQSVRIDGRKIIDLVVATTGGFPLSGPLHDSLSAFLQDNSSPTQLVQIRDYQPVAVRLSLEVHVLPNYLRAETGVRVQQSLGSGLAADGTQGYFNFDQRSLGGALYLSDIYAQVEAIEGVDFLIVRELRAESDAASAGSAKDVVQMPADGVATGGDALDPSVGILNISLLGGLA